jgi:hypothetical protein
MVALASGEMFLLGGGDWGTGGGVCGQRETEHSNISSICKAPSTLTFAHGHGQTSPSALSIAVTSVLLVTKTDITQTLKNELQL